MPKGLPLHLLAYKERTMLKQLIDVFSFISDPAEDPVVRMVEVEYSKEFMHLQKILGRRPDRRDVSHLITI